jgi:hypothetical protein
MALGHFLRRYWLPVVSVVVLTACGRTAVTAGTGGWSTGPPAALIYDDTQRTIHAGEQVDIRLEMALTSEAVAANQTFRAITASDLRNGPRVVVPAGSTVTGIVRHVDRGPRFDDGGRIMLGFVELIANGNPVAIDGVVTQVFESGIITHDQHDGAAVASTLRGGLRSGLTESVLMRVMADDGMMISTQPGMAAVLPAGTIVRVRFTRDVIIQ